jgi:transcription elongation factor Elf1
MKMTKNDFRVLKCDGCGREFAYYVPQPVDNENRYMDVYREVLHVHADLNRKFYGECLVCGGREEEIPLESAQTETIETITEVMMAEDRRENRASTSNIFDETMDAAGITKDLRKQVFLHLMDRYNGNQNVKMQSKSKVFASA